MSLYLPRRRCDDDAVVMTLSFQLSVRRCDLRTRTSAWPPINYDTFYIDTSWTAHGQLMDSSWTAVFYDNFARTHDASGKSYFYLIITKADLGPLKSDVAKSS